MSREPLTVYERIIRAARRGTGTKLSVEDCWVLGQDTAISSRAENCREQLEAEKEAEAQRKRDALVVQPKVRKRK